MLCRSPSDNVAVCRVFEVAGTGSGVVLLWRSTSLGSSNYLWAFEFSWNSVLVVFDFGVVPFSYFVVFDLGAVTCACRFGAAGLDAVTCTCDCEFNTTNLGAVTRTCDFDAAFFKVVGVSGFGEVVCLCNFDVPFTEIATCADLNLDCLCLLFL